MLTREEKKQWVAALRSGMFNQALGQLFTVIDESNYNRRSDPDGRTINKSGNCCLGVFCQSVWKTERQANHGELYAKLREALTLEAVDELIRMNDYHKASFLEIANWIEANVETA